MSSIRRNLLVALLSAMSAVVLLGAFATYRQARQEADEIFDYHLRQIALSTRDQAFPSEPRIQGDEEDFDFVIQVWDREGVKLYFSHPHTTLPDRAQFGFATVHTVEGDWRVYAAPMRGYVIQVAQPLRIRDELAFSAALRALVPFLFLLPLLIALIWIVVGRGLAPLGQVARAVTARTPTALAPLPEQDVPIEVLPLVRSLNALLGRLAQALEAQRAFVADAAHELRTPLTALQLQAQLVERANDATQRTESVTELKRGLQRITRVVQQLLTLAREEPGAAERPLASVDLAQLARLVVAEHSPLAEGKRIDIGASTPDEPVVIPGDAEALRTLIGNLLENAIRYTPPDGRVDVSVGVASGGAYIEVADSGPGIPAQDRRRVFDRFYRLAGMTEPGTGLGLAIVKAIADRHGATVSLGDAALGGLAARVAFPAAPSKQISAARISE